MVDRHAAAKQQDLQKQLTWQTQDRSTSHLECAEDGCEARLALEAGDVVVLPDDDLRQVAELIRPQDDLAAGGGVARTGRQT
jgi:hypothetical protein